MKEGLRQKFLGLLPARPAEIILKGAKMSQVNYTHTISCYTVQSDGFMHWLQGGKKIHCFVAVPTLETGVPGKMMQSKSKHRPSWHYLALDDPDEDLWTYGRTLTSGQGQRLRLGHRLPQKAA